MKAFLLKIFLFFGFSFVKLQEMKMLAFCMICQWHQHLVVLAVEVGAPVHRTNITIHIHPIRFLHPDFHRSLILETMNDFSNHFWFEKGQCIQKRFVHHIYPVIKHSGRSSNPNSP